MQWNAANTDLSSFCQFARFGAMADGLDAAEEERRKIREKVKKYALFDMENVDGEAYSLEETLQVRPANPPKHHTESSKISNRILQNTRPALTRSA
jgi:hypothetical protein